MKIKVINKSYDSVMAQKPPKHKKPIKPNIFFRTLMRLLAIKDLKATNFKYEKVGMEKLGKNEPALYIMNHSSFIDLEIVPKIFYPRPFNIVATTDAFVGKEYLMRHIGCIPTKKFVSEPTLIKDIVYCLKKLKSSVVIFPEAGYSFDGRATKVPKTLAQLVKNLGVPLVMIKTYGAFLRDPLYNNLQVRDVDVSAVEEYLFSVEQIKNMSVDEIDAVIQQRFSFDSFLWQKENKIKIDEPFRADYLHRLLYKCPKCMQEGKMIGEGTQIKCTACGCTHTLTEYGELKSDEKTYFSHIPDWYDWEREQVRNEIKQGTYRMESDVEIMMANGTKCLYGVGDGHIIHDTEGIHLTGCDGKLVYHHKPLSSYTLNSDYNWYEIGDMIGIGNRSFIYYCFPKSKEFSVSKARIAAEQLYELTLNKRNKTEL